MEMQKIELFDRLSVGVQRDITGIFFKLLDKPHVSPRLVRLPVDDFNKAVDGIMQHVNRPFQPVFLTYPVEPYGRDRPAVVCVADDDTNMEKEFKRTIEFSPIGEPT
jgi:hypothetical protein